MTATPSLSPEAPSTMAPSTPVYRPPSLMTRLTGRNGSRLFVALLAVWIIFVTFTAQITAWIQASLTTVAGDPTPWWRAMLVQVALIGIPTLLFAMRWRAVRYRAIFQSWAWAIGYTLLLLPTRLLYPVEGQAIVLLQVGLTLAYWFLARRWQQEKSPVPKAGFALALLVGGLSALPWVRWGALGSWLDVILNGALAAAFGLLVWTLLHVAWIPALRRDPRHPRRDRLVSGLVTGVLLVIMASALSFNGVQLLLMIMLPALGWGVVAAGATALAASLVVAVPLLLVDPDPMVIVAGDWLLLYYFLAAAVSMGVGWLLGVVALLSQPDPAKSVSRIVAWSSAGVALLLAGVIYVTVGTPGFFGDRLFVVMAEQANLEEAAATPDLVARRTAIYDTLVRQADSTQADLRGALDRVGIGYTPYYLVNALEIDGGLFVRLWLATRGDVAEVMVSPHLRPVEEFDISEQDVAPAPIEAQWNLTNIGADRVWRDFGVTGEGIVVGQSDSGVQADHPEFAARYRGLTEGNDYNWFDPWGHEAAPYDLDGHGTHTLGSVLGDSVGIAPGATWFGCANLVRNLGNPAFYLECMQFMLAPFPLAGDPLRDGDPSRAADVLNNSWGCPTHIEGCSPTVFAPAVKALTQAGIFVVVSAGNDGPRCSSLNTPPAIDEEALSVGAIDSAGDLASFSSTGPVTADGSGRIKPDVLAPGVEVLSSWPDSSYKSLSGTSMAGPHMAGVVALIWSANPALRGDIARTKEIIQQTARPFAGGLEGSDALADAPVADEFVGATKPLADMLGIGGHYACIAQSDLSVIPNNVAGYGVVDAYAAVKAALDLQ